MDEARELEWLLDTFSELDEDQHHNRGAGPYDNTSVVRAKRIIDHLTNRDLGIDLNQEAALVFGNAVQETPGVPQLDPAGRARLLFWASQLASMAKELRIEARAQNEAGRTDLGLLLIRLQLSVEETGEWAEALGYGDIVAAFQELVDMSVVTDGHYLTLGLADLKREGYREVHAANMSKVDEDGKAHVDAAGRWIKGPNTRKPDMERVLREAGVGP